ncbi:hypothetical protein TNCV_1950471 [Trichonephila clavipes]|nr:hypothetical protein TNCV_1950471 [Trichonephila clavipes]
MSTAKSGKTVLLCDDHCPCVGHTISNHSTPLVEMRPSVESDCPEPQKVLRRPCQAPTKTKSLCPIDPRFKMSLLRSNPILREDFLEGGLGPSTCLKGTSDFSNF